MASVIERRDRPGCRWKAFDLLLTTDPVINATAIAMRNEGSKAGGQPSRYRLRRYVRAVPQRKKGKR